MIAGVGAVHEDFRRAAELDRLRGDLQPFGQEQPAPPPVPCADAAPARAFTSGLESEVIRRASLTPRRRVQRAKKDRPIARERLPAPRGASFEAPVRPNRSGRRAPTNASRHQVRQRKAGDARGVGVQEQKVGVRRTSNAAQSEQVQASSSNSRHTSPVGPRPYFGGSRMIPS